MASGHGVSEAVRNHIKVWVTEDVVNAIKRPAYLLRDSKAWKRKARRNSPTGFGFEREYYCEGVSDAVKLIVHSPESDYSADRYVFMVGDKAVAGGKTKLQSVMHSSAVSSDKTKIEKDSFTALSAAELEKISVNMTFGKAAMLSWKWSGDEKQCAFGEGFTVLWAEWRILGQR
jgi:hypothetical protein